MKLNQALKSTDITDLTQVSEPKFVWVPDHIWERELKSLMRIGDLDYLADKLKYVAWLDKSMLPSTLLTDLYSKLLSRAHNARRRDRSLNTFVAMQALYEKTKEDLLFSGDIAEGSVEETYRSLRTPESSEDQLRALSMATKLKMLGQDISLLREMIDSYLTLLEGLTQRREPVMVLEYYTSLFVIMRLLFPDRFGELNLAEFELENPEDILLKYAIEIQNGTAPEDYLAVAANLRLIHAYKINFTPVGIKIIDKEANTDPKESLPKQIVF